jgi:hypothetical protein
VFNDVTRALGNEDDWLAGLVPFEAMEAKFKAYIGLRGKPIWETERARAAAYSIIRTIEKQVPAIESWMPQDYRMKLVTAMKAGITARVDKQTSRTEAAGSTIPSMKLIREVLQQMGPPPPSRVTQRYMAAKLQATIVGLRDNLGGVVVRDTDGPEDGDWYNRTTGRLYIKDFKTSVDFPAYDIVLSEDLRDLIRRWLGSSAYKQTNKKGGDFLITSAKKTGPLVSKAFADAGLPHTTLMTIRHSMSTAMQAEQGNGQAAADRVGKQFKHSSFQAFGYRRLTADTVEELKAAWAKAPPENFEKEADAETGKRKRVH